MYGPISGGGAEREARITPAPADTTRTNTGETRASPASSGLKRGFFDRPSSGNRPGASGRHSGSGAGPLPPPRPLERRSNPQGAESVAVEESTRGAETVPLEGRTRGAEPVARSSASPLEIRGLEPHQVRHVPLESYLISNEYDACLFRRALSPCAGRGYVGLGAEQNYDNIANARPAHAWLYDQNPQIPILHGLYRVAFLSSTTPDEFVRFFAGGNEVGTKIAQYVSPGPLRLHMAQVHSTLKGVLTTRLGELRTGARTPGETTFLSSPDKFAFVRQMFMEDRIHLAVGSHSDPELFRWMREDAKARGVDEIRAVYLSNAHQFDNPLGDLPSNIAALGDPRRTLLLFTTDPRLSTAHGSLVSAFDPVQERRVYDPAVPHTGWNGAELHAAKEGWQYVSMPIAAFQRGYADQVAAERRLATQMRLSVSELQRGLAAEVAKLDKSKPLAPEALREGFWAEVLMALRGSVPR